jgi:hypothetical protein
MAWYGGDENDNLREERGEKHMAAATILASHVVELEGMNLISCIKFNSYSRW